MKISKDVLGFSCARSLYLFSHPDDEIFIRPLISRNFTNSNQSLILILTNCDSSLKKKKSIRIRESQNSLNSIGVNSNSIIFLGNKLNIDDGKLYLNINLVLNYIREEIISVNSFDMVFSHAWEGGHPNHDAAYFISRCLSEDLNC